MNKLVGHLKTVHTHRKEVRKLCFGCGLYKQGIIHDLSKYSPVELISSVKYYTGKRSPIDSEIEDIGYSTAWLHHKGHNKHHYEYWMDPAHGDVPVEMPLKYFLEMFCDRLAASKTYLKDAFTDDAPLKWTTSHPKERDLMNPNTYNDLIKLQTYYKDHGEEETFSLIKNYLAERKMIRLFNFCMKICDIHLDIPKDMTLEEAIENAKNLAKSNDKSEVN